MRAIAVIAQVCASASISKQIFRVLVTAILLMSASFSLLAQSLAVSPATLTFPNQAVGSTSAAKIVTVANKGTSSQAVAFAPSAGFGETDNCGGTIASGASCKVSVSFTPTLVEKLSGALNVNDKSNDLRASVTLNGTGIAQTTLTPATLDFGSQAVGAASAAKTVTSKK